MSDLVGNPEDRFSQNEAHITFSLCNLSPMCDTGANGVSSMPCEPRHEKTNILVPTGSDTNRAVQLQKMARGLKFRI